MAIIARRVTSNIISLLSCDEPAIDSLTKKLNEILKVFSDVDEIP